MITRRELLIMLGVSALAAPLRSFAQQQDKVWRVGYLSPRFVESLNSDPFGGFPKGMRELGYVEGKNLVIEWRLARGNAERLPGLAAELVQLKVDVIVTAGTQATRAAQKATATIPIVMGAVSDPVGSGLVASLPQPGGNTTGLSILTPDLSLKHLDMLLVMVPKLSRVAVLLNPDNSSDSTVLKKVQTAGQKTGITILPMETRTPQEIENAFAKMARERTGAVIVVSAPLFVQQGSQIAELAVKNRLPSISPYRENAETGVLISYGQNLADSYRRAAIYVDKIFKGAKPADLPVEQPTIFELLINGKTAKALGLKIPNDLLIRADKVIE